MKKLSLQYSGKIILGTFSVEISKIVDVQRKKMY